MAIYLSFSPKFAYILFLLQKKINTKNETVREKE